MRPQAPMYNFSPFTSRQQYSSGSPLSLHPFLLHPANLRTSSKVSSGKPYHLSAHRGFPAVQPRLWGYPVRG
ncbi:MAG: hypothetical protein QXT28_02990 [Thermofilaceae archaeon]